MSHSLFTLAVVGVAASAATGAPKSPSITYFDEVRQLQIDPDRAVVQWASSAGLGARGDAVLERAGIAPNRAVSWFDTWVVVHDEGRAPSERLAAITDDAEVAFVSPVFQAAGDLPFAVTNQIVVRFGPNMPRAKAQQVIERCSAGRIIEEDFAGLDNAFLLECDAKRGLTVLERANELAAQREVYYAEPVMVSFAQPAGGATTNDTYAPFLWGHNNTGQALWCSGPGVVDVDMNVAEAWTVTMGDPSVVVMVLDQGVQQGHPDINQLPGVDFTGNGTGGGPLTSCDNHGTPAAGLISATANNNLGTVGVAPLCPTIAAKVAIYECGATWSTVMSIWVANALNWARANGVRVTNTSYHFTPSALITDAYNSTHASGIVHFSSAGNQGQNLSQYPAQLRTVISNGAVDHLGELPSWTNFGNTILIMAPGNYLPSADRTGFDGYTSTDLICYSGTSASSPMAAGAAALYLSAHPEASPVEVANALAASAKDLGAPGVDTLYSWGLVDAFAALDPPASTVFPSAFDLVAPADGAGPLDTTVQTVFSWQLTDDPWATYAITISENPDLSDPLIHIPSTPATNGYVMPPDTLGSERTYYWGIVATNIWNNSTASTRTFSFTSGFAFECPGDTDGDLSVNLLDIQNVLFDFGVNGDSDVTQDGWTDLDDLQVVLFYFGSRCE